MKVEKDIYKLLAAGVIGAVGGFILGEYLRGKDESPRPLSKHLATLSKVLEQIEGIDTKEAENLKERIHNIITAIESNYGINKG